MAIIPINSLPPFAPSIMDGSEEFAMEVGGTTYKVSLDEMASHAPNKHAVTTVGNTPTTIATIPLADDSTYTYEFAFAARRTDAPDRASYFRRGSFYREAAGVATLNGPVTSGFTRESDGLWDVDVDVVGNDIVVQVTGGAGQTVEWCLLYFEVTTATGAPPVAPEFSIWEETGASYTPGTNGENFVLADATAASQTMNLPATGRNTYIVKKKDATANTVTLDPAGGATIDGAATLVISTQYAAFMVSRDDNGDWWIS